MRKLLALPGLLLAALLVAGCGSTVEVRESDLSVRAATTSFAYAQRDIMNSSDTRTDATPAGAPASVAPATTAATRAARIIR